jgi:hypothetical protein
MTMPRRRTLIIVAAVAASFIVLAGSIVLLAQAEAIGFGIAKLMLVALLAIYIGFGFLIAVYRLMDWLE